jgi:VCBS repeat-containing protein
VPFPSTLGATVTLHPNGSFTYDPQNASAINKTFQGDYIDDYFSYTIHDEYNGTATTFVQLVVEGRNDNPVAMPDSYYADPDIPLYVNSTTGLTSNDYDIDIPQESSQAAAATPPKISVVYSEPIITDKEATVTMNSDDPDGSFVYDPRESDAIQNCPEEELELGIHDWFEYFAVDEGGLVSLEPTRVDIIVKKSESPGLFVVAKTGEDNFDDLGQGPSINNVGQIAFTASTATGNGYSVDSVYVWDPTTDRLKSLISEGFLSSFQPTNDLSQIPAMDFTDNVQITDPINDQVPDNKPKVITNRYVNVNGAIFPPTMISSMTILGSVIHAPTPMLLTSQEIWEVGSEYMPINVATGDMGWYGAGGIWDNSWQYYFGQESINPVWGPLNIQMAYNIRARAANKMQAMYAGIFNFGFVGAAFSAAQSILTDPDSMRPEFVPFDPSWAGIFYSPMQIKTAFTATYPQVAVNNKGETASATWGSSELNKQNWLVTTPHNGYDPFSGYYQFGVGTPGYIASAKIADNGIIVLRNESGDGNSQTDSTH